MTIIQRRVYLEPKYLDENIMVHLLAKVSSITLGECTKEYGYIISVNKIVKILNNEDTVFTLLFDADTLKPDAGTKLDGIVCMVYKDGIFINVVNKLKVLIPSIILKGYLYDENLATYVSTNKKIKQGDNINVVVTASKFSKKGFICVGSLV